MVGMAGHGQGNVEPPGADGQHGDPGGSGGVAVGPDHRQPGVAEALHVHLVGDPVAGPGKVKAVAGAGSLQVLVVVGVLVVGLQQVVVDILGREVGLDPVQAEGLEFEHGHGAGGVLEQGMIDPDGDLLAGDELSLDQVIFENFAGEVPCHNILPVVEFPS